jgi:hypothetical protein
MTDLFGPITPIVLLAMIAALVELAKSFGISGNWNVVMAIALGIVIGVGYQVTSLLPAAAPWFTIVVYGILFGLTAAGLYRIGQRFAEK